MTIEIQERDGKAVLEITSLDVAIELAIALQNGKSMVFPDEIIFSGDIGSLTIEVDGENYRATVPGAFARGIWGFQEEIYRATAFALYGTEDLRRLTKADYDRFNLIFSVSNGCSNLDAQTSGFLSELAKGLSNMDDTKKLKAIISVAIVLATGYTVTSIGGAYLEHKASKAQTTSSSESEKARLAADVEKERERTKQIEALVGASPVSSRFGEAAANGAKQVVKSVPDATEASIGNTVFSRPEILEINARSARESSDNLVLKQEFKIMGFRRVEGSDIAKFTLTSSAGEIPALLDMTEEGPFTKEQLKQFWSAAEYHTPIFLHVQTKAVGGQIKQAWISDIPAQRNVIPQSD
ncbi:hypothetical protein [Orrella marina]|uniref:Uncharacterized protein n=1 Tax=Orrella marina TaxID=2163011 RepID=A0A2R4XFA8_9BURK|nr:hypothetical protein [Orrella marina]AWB32393.1 hypothetical protein DBV39_00220 [Orrella marina]